MQHGNSHSNTQSLINIQQQIALGNAQAFRALYDLYFQKLWQFAKAIVKTKDAAIEVVDEVFVSIWRNKETIQKIENLKVYLYTATRNKALTFLSKRVQQKLFNPFDDANVEICDELSPDQQMITTEIFHKIHQAVNNLPPKCKIIFKLVREEGLKYKEVAQVLQISENTVDAQMVIAVKKISEAVKVHFNSFPKSGKKNSSKK
jgi:RNA polymerase sigma-70 factor (ECF subfamily)